MKLAAPEDDPSGKMAGGAATLVAALGAIERPERAAR